MTEENSCCQSVSRRSVLVLRIAPRKEPTFSKAEAEEEVLLAVDKAVLEEEGEVLLAAADKEKATREEGVEATIHGGETRVEGAGKEMILNGETREEEAEEEEEVTTLYWGTGEEVEEEAEGAGEGPWIHCGRISGTAIKTTVV